MTILDNTNNSSDFEFSSMQERNQQTLTDIKNLQEMEQQLYTSLEQNATRNTLTQEQKDQIVNKINEISQMRLNLYANLKDIYSFFQQNVSSSRTTLAEQMMAIDIVENELNESKRRLQLLEDEKYNKLRLVEINTYYGKKYNAHANVMKTVVIICIPLLILGLLSNRGLLPQNIANILMAIIIIIGVFAIGAQILDISNRDNMNYDEYDWAFKESDAPTDNNNTLENNPWDFESPSLECVGAACCNDQSTYDTEKNLCVPTALYDKTQKISKASNYRGTNTSTE